MFPFYSKILESILNLWPKGIFTTTMALRLKSTNQIKSYYLKNALFKKCKSSCICLNNLIKFPAPTESFFLVFFFIKIKIPPVGFLNVFLLDLQPVVNHFQPNIKLCLTKAECSSTPREVTCYDDRLGSQYAK